MRSREHEWHEPPSDRSPWPRCSTHEVGRHRQVYFHTLDGGGGGFQESLIYSVSTTYSDPKLSRRHMTTNKSMWAPVRCLWRQVLNFHSASSRSCWLHGMNTCSFSDWSAEGSAESRYRTIRTLCCESSYRREASIASKLSHWSYTEDPKPSGELRCLPRDRQGHTLQVPHASQVQQFHKAYHLYQYCRGGLFPGFGLYEFTNRPLVYV